MNPSIPTSSTSMGLKAIRASAHTFNMGDAKYFRMGGVRKTSHGIPLRYEDVAFELHNIAYTITEITQLPRKAALTGAGDKKLF